MEEAQISSKKFFLIGESKVLNSDKTITIDKDLSDILTNIKYLISGVYSDMANINQKNY